MKNRITAAIIAFFLGPLGIHKFYLGENVAGILYLIFSWTFIPSLFAFFDFIGLLLTNDEAFNARYNPGFFTNTTNNKSISASQSSTTTTETLMKLKKLYDSGVITAEEYEEKRRKYLDSL